MMLKPWVALFLCLSPSLVWAKEYPRPETEGSFAVREAHLSRQDDNYLLHADIDYRLPPAVQEALANNVPITLVVELKIQRGRRLLWNETVLKEQLRYRLRYHALSRFYQVQPEGGSPRNFATLDAAVQALGSIRQLNIASAARFMLGVTYKARLRTYLDFEALPLPLRSVAYLKPQWHLGSPWYRWTYAE